METRVKWQHDVSSLIIIEIITESESYGQSGKQVPVLASTQRVFWNLFIESETSVSNHEYSKINRASKCTMYVMGRTPLVQSRLRGGISISSSTDTCSPNCKTDHLYLIDNIFLWLHYGFHHLNQLFDVDVEC